MLKSYTIYNFKSFKNQVTIDLAKTKYEMLANTNTINGILKGALFYGANASGKSNVILPIILLLDMLFAKNDIDIRQYFCLNATSPEMRMSFDFVIDEHNITYQIEYLLQDNIINERLILDKTHILNRKGSIAHVVGLTENSDYNNISNSSVFLREIYFNTRFRNNKILQKWFEFLKNSVAIDMYNRTIFSHGDDSLNLMSYIDKYDTKLINDFFYEYNFDQRISYEKQAKGGNIKISSDNPMIFFHRTGIDTPMPEVMESLGNQNLLRLLPCFFSVIGKGGMLIIDEFSSGFHNDLEKLLIKYFMRKSGNAQLFAVSHSTNILSNAILRPDQLYSVDFLGQSSVLHRFSDEHPRESQNIEKMYLGGVFDGLPNYKMDI